MRTIVDEISVEYRQLGSGSDLVMVHGWMDNLHTFDKLAQKLSKSFRVTVLDLPNFGKTEINRDVTSIDQYVRFLSAFISKLELRKYVLLGHSMGGQIIILGTGEGILKPKKLILIASAGVRAKKNKLRVGSKLVGPLIPKKIKASFYRKIGSDYNPSLSDVHKNVVKQALSTDVQTYAKKINVPTLLIYGDKDEYTPTEYGKIFQKNIRGSRLVVLNGESHWLHQSQTEKIADSIRRFLK